MYGQFYYNPKSVHKPGKVSRFVLAIRKVSIDLPSARISRFVTLDVGSVTPYLVTIRKVSINLPRLAGV